MMAKTVHSSFEKHLGDEAARFGRIGTEVDARKWNLGTSTAVHSVEVMDEAFHGLERLMLRVFFSFFKNGCRHFLGEFLVVAIANIVSNGEFNLVTSEFFVLFNIALQALAEGLVDAWCESVVEVWNGLTTVLLVLVGLEDNGSEGSGSTDGIWRAEEAVASIKAVFEKL